MLFSRRSRLLNVGGLEGLIEAQAMNCYVVFVGFKELPSLGTKSLKISSSTDPRQFHDRFVAQHVLKMRINRYPHC
jgi:hypothetical protein